MRSGAAAPTSQQETPLPSVPPTPAAVPPDSTGEADPDPEGGSGPPAATGQPPPGRLVVTATPRSRRRQVAAAASISTTQTSQAHLTPPISPEEAEALLPLFNQGLFTVYRAWRVPLFEISRALLTLISAPRNEDHARLCTAAFLLLPGLIREAVRLKRSTVKDLLDTLRKWAMSSSTDRFGLPACIFRIALDWKPLVVDRNAQEGGHSRSLLKPRRRPAKAYVRQIEALIREKRISAAMNTLQQYHDAYGSLTPEDTPPPGSRLGGQRRSRGQRRRDSTDSRDCPTLEP